MTGNWAYGKVMVTHIGIPRIAFPTAYLFFVTRSRISCLHCTHQKNHIGKVMHF